MKINVPPKSPALLFASALLSPFFMTGAQAVPLSQFLQNTPTPTIQAYKTIDSTPLNLEVFKPDDWKATDQRPAVVLIHGGAWVAGDGKVFYPHARYFASRGAVAICIEYRLETATGSSFENCFTDCKSAMRYIRAHAADLGVNPDQITAMGDSAGGHLAAALGTCQGFDDPADDIKVSPAPNAMVLCNPIVDMTEGTWIKFVMRGEAMTNKKLKAGDLKPTDEQTKRAQALSPLFQVKPGEPPALLMHGTEDPIVNPKQSQEFADAAKKAGNRCDLIWMEGSRHAFVLPKYTAPEPVVVKAINQADAFIVSLGWLKGTPTLEASNPPAWVPKGAKK